MGSRKLESCCLTIKMLLELSMSNPGKKGAKLTSQCPQQNSSSSCLETLACSLIQMHLALENIQSSNSQTRGGCVVSSHSTSVSNTTGWQLCHRESGISISFTT